MGASGTAGECGGSGTEPESNSEGNIQNEA